ncbi:hypothetical protein ACFVYD_29625 [Streptomyces sp. NPDC058301]|uniref:hypothetical protein n=1 Tax=Streptomyces sp. NPDC058301 TaxID=3346436 RepID=UPI0036EB3CC2
MTRAFPPSNVRRQADDRDRHEDPTGPDFKDRHQLAPYSYDKGFKHAIDRVKYGGTWMGDGYLATTKGEA